MLTDKAREIVRADSPWLKWAMGLASWTVNIEYIGLPAGTIARCNVDASYDIADIEIDPEQHNTRADILDSLRHELAHALHSEYGVLECAIGNITSDRERAILEVIESAAREKTVLAIEAMLDRGLGLSPAKMIRRAKARV